MSKSILYQIIFWLVFFPLSIYSDGIWNNFNAINIIIPNNIVFVLLGFLISCFIFYIYRNLKNTGLNKATLYLLISLFLIVLTYFWALSHHLSWYLLDNSPNLPEFKFYWHAYLNKSIKLLIVQTASLFIWFIAAYVQTIQVKNNKIQELSKLTNEAQLEMLRYQLNPHFIFNVLNNIQANIKESPYLANKLLLELSDYFRYTLLNPSNGFVSLSEEIKTVQQYVSIQNERYKSNFNVSWDIDENLNIEIPFFIVMLLVENAIKHGIKSSKNNFKMWVSIKHNFQSLSIAVKNTGSITNNNLNKLSTHTGLNNLKQRLQLIYDSAASFNLFEYNNIVTAEIKIELSR